MPNRILREGINSSERVNSLSIGAEILYRRLLSVVDDYGRFHAAPATVLGACWPTTPDRVCLQDVSNWLAECAQGDRPLLTIYTHGSSRYLQLTDFNQTIRSKSKYPEPVINLQTECVQPESKVFADCEQSASTRRSSLFDIRSSDSVVRSATATTDTSQQSPGRIDLDRFPLTCEQIVRLFLDTDNKLLARILQHCTTLALDPEVTDEEIFQGVQAVYKADQRSAALFEKTLPQWLINRRRHPPLRR